MKKISVYQSIIFVVSLTISNAIFAQNSTHLGATEISASARTLKSEVNVLQQLADKRLVSNIERLDYGLNEVLKLDPKSYNWISNPTANPQLGLIAQDVKILIPEVVHGDESKETLRISYTDIIPVLINTLKDQQEQLKQLSISIKSTAERLKEMPVK